MKRVFIIILFIVLFSSIMMVTVNADSSDGIIGPREFNSLNGEYKYLKSDFVPNYYLDIEELGILDSGAIFLNYAANVIFTIVWYLGYGVVILFYFCFTFDISDLLGTQINTIQAAMKSSIFDAFFILAFAFAALEFLKKLLQRNVSGILSDFAKILSIILLSYFVVSHSAIALTGATEITKSIGISAITALTGQNDSESMAANIAGSLWKSLVHDPWVTLEFNDSNVGANDSEVEELLSLSPSNPQRQQKAQEYFEQKGWFSKNMCSWRIGVTTVYLIPFFVKCCVFMLMAVMQLAFQVMALFYVLLAPVILLMALVPALGGIDLVFRWFKKIVESQLMILIVTFLVGVITTVDSILYSFKGQYGWFIVILVETLISVIVFLNYKTILAGFGKINSVSSSVTGTVQKAMSHKQSKADDGIYYNTDYREEYNGSKRYSNSSSQKVLGQGNNNIRSRIQTQMEAEPPAASQAIPLPSIPEQSSVTEARHIEIHRGSTPYLDAIERGDVHTPAEHPMMPHNVVPESVNEAASISEIHNAARPLAAEQIADSDSPSPAVSRPITSNKMPHNVVSESANEPANIPEIHNAARPLAAEQIADSDSPSPAVNRPTTAEEPPAAVFGAPAANSPPVSRSASAGDSPAEQSQHTVHADFAAANVSASGARGNIERPTLSQLDTAAPPLKQPLQRPPMPERPQRTAYSPRTPADVRITSGSSSAPTSRPNTPH